MTHPNDYIPGKLMHEQDVTIRLVDLMPRLNPLIEDDHATVSDAVLEINTLRSRLPEGMEDCIIVFRQCPDGHGWLTASNWLPRTCPECVREDLAARLGRQKKRFQAQAEEIEELKREMSLLAALV